MGQVVQVFHLLVSAAVFASIVLPWLPRLRSRARNILSRVSSSGPSRGRLLTPHSSRPASPSLSPSSSSLGSSDEDSPTRDGTVHGRWAVLKSIFSTSRGAPDEAQQLRSALGIHSGVLGLAFQTLQPPRPSRARSLHARSLEQRAYVRLGELAALSGSMAERAHLFAAMRTHTDAFRASARDLATLALLVRPWSSTRGKALWDQARSAGEERTRACEAVALEMEVEEAASVLKGMSGVRESGKAPLTALGEYLVAERITGVAARMFVAAVNGVQEEEEMEDRIGLIRAGEDASGSVRALAGRFRAVLSGASGSFDDENAMDAASEEDDGHALLRALGLFRSVFGGQGQTPKMRLALRAALGARAFERRDVDGLEDARDRAVDMVVDCERAARRV